MFYLTKKKKGAQTNRKKKKTKKRKTYIRIQNIHIKTKPLSQSLTFYNSTESSEKFRI